VLLPLAVREKKKRRRKERRKRKQKKEKMWKIFGEKNER
jgi:hypothetical protein